MVKFVDCPITFKDMKEYDYISMYDFVDKIMSTPESKKLIKDVNMELFTIGKTDFYIDDNVIFPAIEFDELMRRYNKL